MASLSIVSRGRRMKVLWIVLLALAGCDMPQPEVATAAVSDVVDHAASAMVVSADPLASEAGLDMLRQGGTAVDAAIAVQAVLGLVEPQASGLLGGNVMLVFTPDADAIHSYDGMATAPKAATRALMLGRKGGLLDPREVAFSARAVGVPGVLPAMWAAHQAHGKLPWASLFEPAIKLAEAGVPVRPQLHALLAEPGADNALAGLRAPYLKPNGAVPAVGTIFRNREYAAVLRRVALLGPKGLYAEGGMKAVLDALSSGAHPSLITAADLTEAQPRVDHALCGPWQGMRICTAPAPSMGGMVMLQILGMVPPGDPEDPSFVHRFLEASRLAEADRRRYMADPGFVDVPVAGLLNPAYLAERAAMITAGHSISQPRPGEIDAQSAYAPDPHAPQSATSSLAVVDAAGMVVAATSTINLHFGARISAEGMIFNNAMLNFAPPPPTTLPGKGGHYANEMEGGKRPVSPIAPLIVLDRAGRPILAGGGAGGAPIPDTMAVALIEVLARHAAPADALALGHFHAADPDHIALEAATKAEALRAALQAAGHRVEIEPVDTGNVLLLRSPEGWSGATDPRRDGGGPQGLR
jgi:gamma-glutamyltranspeptidase/glutathione hydrolase